MEALFAWGSFSFIVAVTVLILTTYMILFPQLEPRLSSRKASARKRIIERLALAPCLKSYQLSLRELSFSIQYFFTKPYSFKAFNRCFAMTFLYQLLLFIVAWGITGESRMGSLQLLVSTDNPIYRFLIICAFSGIFILNFFIFIRLDQIVLYINNIPQRIAGLFMTINPDRTGVLSGLLVGLFAVAIAGTVAVSSAFIFSGAFANDFIFAGAFACAVACSVTGVVAFVGTDAGTSEAAAIESACFGAFAGASAFVFAVAFAGKLETTTVILIFYALLPGINAFISQILWAFSRHIIIQSIKGKNSLAIMRLILLNILAVLALQVVLSVLLPNAVELIKLLLSYGNEPVSVEWRSMVITAAREPFGEGLIVTGMLLMIILPAGLHMMYGLGGMFLGFSRSSRTLARQLPYSPGSNYQPELREIEKSRIHSIYQSNTVVHILAGTFVTSLFFGLYSAFAITGISFGEFLAQVALTSTQWAL
ncbi:MAG: hypothetical protein ACRBBN_06590 [Methyloligellaceae bacterium]